MMNKAEDSSQKRRQQQASGFVSRLFLDRMQEGDQQALEQWLAESEQNALEYQAALDAWHCIGALADRKDEFAEELYPKRKKYSVFKWPLAMAASLVVAVAAGFMIWNNDPAVQPDNQIVSYATATGEQKTINLEDGSTVTLNTNSRLIVDFNADRRRLILERGEGFFEVAKNESQPFVLNAGERSVTVLGTEFNVRLSGLQLDVAVSEGEVAVHRRRDKVTALANTIELNGNAKNTLVKPATQYRLKAGTAARFSGVLGDSSSTVVASSVAAGKFPPWRYGLLRVDNEPLYQVVKELNRYAKEKILIEDSRIMHLKLSGVFQVDSIDAILSRLETMFGLNVTRYPDRIVIVGGDAELF